MQNTEAVPAGYMKDAQGRLVPVESIRQIDLERNNLVTEIVDQAKSLAGVLATFKTKTMQDVQAFVELSAEKYNARLGGRVGNVTLTSFDGRYKVIRSIDEHQVFDERLQAAKALVDECLTEWVANSSAEVRTLVTGAFQVDKQGRINVNRILSLRRLEIADERWKQAMQAIGESLQTVGSKPYLRIYERQADGGYKPLPLDIAA